MSKTPFSLTRRQALISGAALGAAWIVPGLRNAVWAAGSDAPEKAQVRVGFIPLTDCAPVVMASVKGFDKSMVSHCRSAKRRAGRRCATN